jgi:hypothetical protein
MSADDSSSSPLRGLARVQAGKAAKEQRRAFFNTTTQKTDDMLEERRQQKLARRAQFRQATQGFDKDLLRYFASAKSCKMHRKSLGMRFESFPMDNYNEPNPGRTSNCRCNLQCETYSYHTDKCTGLTVSEEECGCEVLSFDSRSSAFPDVIFFDCGCVVTCHFGFHHEFSMSAAEHFGISRVQLAEKIRSLQKL